MAIEVSSTSAICYRCGTMYGSKKGHFPVSYSTQHRGVGYMPICKDCISSMYNSYLSQCNDPKKAVRQMCRKLDLFWSDAIFDYAVNKSTPNTLMSKYINRINGASYANKSYDDSLADEGTLWNFGIKYIEREVQVPAEQDASDELEEKIEIPEEIINFWGAGYQPEMYLELEQRRQYWMSQYPEGTELDIGTEAIIRQICALEIDINRDRIAGRPVDKSLSVLNSLLGSGNLKPAQQQNNANSSLDKTPFGVWIQKFETQRPIPEPDPELKDVDGIIRYISIWFLGHLCKMLGIKNTYSKLYEEEIAKRRVDRPEYDDEDDETFFNDIFSVEDSDE